MSRQPHRQKRLIFSHINLFSFPFFGFFLIGDNFLPVKSVMKQLVSAGGKGLWRPASFGVFCFLHIFLLWVMSDQHSLTPGFRQQKLRLEVFRQRRGQNSASFQKRFGIFRLAVSSDRITQFEPQKTKQKQRAALTKCNPVQIGCPTWIRTTINAVRVRCPAVRRWGNRQKLE